MSLVRFFLITLLFFVGIARADDLIYFSNLGTAQIEQTSLDGSNHHTIAKVPNPPYGLALDAMHNRLYWTDQTSGTVMSADTNGSNETVVVAGLYVPIGIAVAGDKIFFTEGYTSRTVSSANLDGSGRTVIFDPLTSSLPDGPYPSAGWLATDVLHGKIYWTDLSRFKIFRANFDGSNQEEITTYSQSETSLSTLAIDAKNGFLYYCDGNSINRSTLDGAKAEVFATLPTSCLSLATDSVNENIFVSAPSASSSIIRINTSTKAQTNLLKGFYTFSLVLDVNRTATPQTIPNLPAVTVRDHQATILFEKFSFGMLKATSRGRRASKKTKTKSKTPQKLIVGYESYVARTADASGKVVKKDIQHRMAKRNVLTLNNLKAGSYTIRYRATLSERRSGKKVAVTRFSPTETFVVE